MGIPPGEGGRLVPGEGWIWSWNYRAGWGFIQPHDGTYRLFCHRDGLVDGDGSVMRGDHVTYFKVFSETHRKYSAVQVRWVPGGGGDFTESDLLPGSGEIVQISTNWNGTRFGRIRADDGCTPFISLRGILWATRTVSRRVIV